MSHELENALNFAAILAESGFIILVCLYFLYSCCFSIPDKKRHPIICKKTDIIFLTFEITR